MLGEIKMSKKAYKLEAREIILAAIGSAYEAVQTNQERGWSNHTKEDVEELQGALDGEMKRIERIFNYIPGSWHRGS
jgi:hypothetical protein